MNKKEFGKLLKMAENGNAEAMYLVGLAYEAGDFVEADINEAVAWMKSATELGNEEALDWLREYYFDDDAGVQAYS